jgi:hypothetical protein
MAAGILLDRGWGKAPVSINVNAELKGELFAGFDLAAVMALQAALAEIEQEQPVVIGATCTIQSAVIEHQETDEETSQLATPVGLLTEIVVISMHNHDKS